MPPPTPAKPHKPVPAVGSKGAKPPPPPPPKLTRLTVHVVKSPGDENIKEAFVEVLGHFSGKTAANGKVTTHPIPPGKHVIKVFKKGFGPFPKKPEDEFKSDFTLIEERDLAAGDQTAKMVLSDGTGQLLVKVVSLPWPNPVPLPAPAPVGDCEVELVGKQKKLTAAKGASLGEALLTKVPAGKPDLKVRKVGYGPTPKNTFDPLVYGEATPDAPAPEVFAGRETVVKITLRSAGITVTKIRATIGGTKQLGSATGGGLAAITLAESTSADLSLKTNKPVSLVRGCNGVELSVDTNPAGKGVSWEVKANENSSAPPGITVKDSGKKADLATDKPGSFAVIAADGESRVVWNVVFVWVKVDVGSSVVVARKTTYVDGGSNAAATRISSGAFAAGSAAFEASVNVELVGGGADKSIGAARINLHVLQNGTTDTLTGNYVGPPAPGGTPVTGTGTETPPSTPIVDATGPGGSAPSPPNTPLVPDTPSAAPPFIWLSPAAKVTSLGSRKFQVSTIDSPGGGFPKMHGGAPPKNAVLRTISGVNAFRSAVAATSKDAVNAIVVAADLRWTADFSGNVNYPPPAPPPPPGTAPPFPPAGTGTYARTTAGTTTASAKFNRISDATGGQDAHAAGFQIFGPRFNSAAGQVIVWA